MLSLVMATAWLFIKREYLLEYFYFSQLLGLTHLLTLGFLSSRMMGVLHRLSPTLLRVEASSYWVGRAQGPGKNNYPFLDADPSRLAALLVGHISRYYSLLAP